MRSNIKKPELIMYLLILIIFSCKKDEENLSIVYDADGNLYHTIKIGNQTWMVENLRTTKFNDGTSIPIIEDSTEWVNKNTAAFCWYNNDEKTFKNPNGALYNWYAVSSNKLCPKGWHVPTDLDWTELTDYLGGLAQAGGKLKETGTIHWNAPNNKATNSTGFTSIPAGARHQGKSLYMGETALYWSSTEMNSTKAYIRAMDTWGDMGRFDSEKNMGLPVRCVKD